MHTTPQSPRPAGSPWFKVRKVSKEQYREMLERTREAAESEESGTDSGSEAALPETTNKRSAKDRIDSAW